MLKLSYAFKSGAGAHEQERFENGRRAFRKRVLPVLRLVLLAISAPCILYEFWHPSTGHFIAGFTFGACAACYLWARDEVPAHVQRHGDGAEGERATANALRPLISEGWHVIHNVDTGRGNRDHVLVGPAGVFLLDSKRLGGTVSIEGDTIHVERVDDPRDSYRLDRVAGALRADAARLHDELKERASLNVWVNAIVVFWSHFDAGQVAGQRVTFIHGSRLLEWLRDQPQRYDQATTDRAAQIVGK